MEILLGRFQLEWSVPHLASLHLIPRSVVRLELPFVLLHLHIVIGPHHFPMEYALLGFAPNRAPLAIIHWFNQEHLTLRRLEALPKISIDLKNNEIRKYEFNTYGIQKYHSFIHYFEVCSHLWKVIAELVHEVLYLSCFYFDDKRVWKLQMLCRNNKIICLWDQHFDWIIAIS